MKNKSLFVLLCIICIIGCAKKDTQENLYIRGRLFLTDTIILNKIDSPLGGKKVILSDGESLNYLYSTTTNSEGYFLFNLINDDKTNFVIRFQETIGGYVYTGKINTTKGQSDLVMPVRLDILKQNGFFGRAMDSIDGGMPNATVSIYNSLVLANLNNPSGAVETLTTDNTGRFFKINLPSGIYYLKGKKTVGTQSFENKAIQKIEVDSKGIKPIDPLVLK